VPGQAALEQTHAVLGDLRMGCVFRHLDASSLQTGPLQQALREPWQQRTELIELRHCPIVPCQQPCVPGSSHTCCICAGVRRMYACALSRYHNVTPLMPSTETKALAISHATSPATRSHAPPV
jgi:hypothetical protein